MLIPYLTCNDIIPQKLGTNVTSAVITGLMCRVREVGSCEVQASTSQWALPGNTIGPTKAVVESCCDNPKRRRNQSTTLAMKSGLIF